VARKFGQLFKRQGLLPSDTVIITSGTNLQGQYVGETKNKVIKLMKQARGGILFIDEAYGLNPGKGNWGYATEAVDTLVGQITEAEFKGNLLVIMAGYASQVDEMFQNVNPGLRSRFDKKRVQFPAWTGEQAAAVAVQEIDRDGKSITEDAKDELVRCFSEMAKDSSWASARDVLENILPAMYSKRASRMVALTRRSAPDADEAGDSPALSAPLADPTRIPYDVPDVVEAFEICLGPRVPQIDSAEALAAALEARDKLVVVDFFATWCGPCKKFAPKFAEMKKEFKRVGFIRVDVDKNPAGGDYEIEAVPTCTLHLNGEVVKRIAGADDRALRQFLVEYEKVRAERQAPLICLRVVW
jgi:thioredoxin